MIKNAIMLTVTVFLMTSCHSMYKKGESCGCGATKKTECPAEGCKEGCKCNEKSK